MLDGMSTKIVDKMTPAQCRAARGLRKSRNRSLRTRPSLGSRRSSTSRKNGGKFRWKLSKQSEPLWSAPGSYSSTKTGAGKALGVESLGFQGENRRGAFSSSVGGVGGLGPSEATSDFLGLASAAPARRFTGRPNLSGARPVMRLNHVSVEGFGDHPELDDEVARKVFRLDLTALFAPHAEEG